MARKEKSKSRSDSYKALQQRLWSSVSREALSPVTLGIAHDLNNHLTGILSMSDLCLREMDSKKPLREQLRIIHGSAQQAAALLRTLFTEHQAEIGRIELHDLNTLATTCLELARRAISKSIKIDLVLSTDPLPVHVDAVAFRTAFLHMVANASEAMDGKGELQIQTLSESKAPPTADRDQKKTKRPWAGLSVRDTAPGVKRSLGQLGPFGTTKTGKSAGLGLYILQQFAEASGGFYSLQSDRRVGTTIAIWLPQAELE